MGIINAIGESGFLRRLPPLLTACALAVSAFAQDQVNLTIRTADQETGEPIEQVRVDVVVFPNSIVDTNYSDGGGRVEFLSLKKRSYILRASKDGYQPRQETLDLSMQMASAIVTIRLSKVVSKSEPTPSSGGVSVRVLSIPEKARKEFRTGMDLLGKKNKPKDSIKHFRRAIEEYPEYHEAYYLLGMALLKTGDASGGETALRKSIELDAGFLDPYYPLAELLIMAKKYEEAERLLEAPYRQDAESWKWPYELAMCYDKLGEWRKGIDMAVEALGRKDAPSKTRLLLANLYECNNEIDKAIEQLEAFKKEDPKNPMIPKVNLVLEQLRRRR